MQFLFKFSFQLSNCDEEKDIWPDYIFYLFFHFLFLIFSHLFRFPIFHFYSFPRFFFIVTVKENWAWRDFLSDIMIQGARCELKCFSFILMITILLSNLIQGAFSDACSAGVFLACGITSDRWVQMF